MGNLRLSVVEGSELAIGDSEDCTISGELQAARGRRDVDTVDLFTGVHIPHSLRGGRGERK